MPAREVRRAVFPVAGLGTRMLPMTRAVPKEMLPVVDRPLIQYAVEEAVAAGISELVFVIDRPRPLLETHFRAVPVLAGKIETSAGGERLDAARALLPDGVHLVFVHQERPLGLGHAVWCAREAVGGEPFAVLLPDDLMVPGSLGELIEVFHARDAAGVRRGGGGPTGGYGPLRDRGHRRGSRSGRPGAVDRREASSCRGPFQPRGGRKVRVRRLDHGSPHGYRPRGGGRDPAHRRDRRARGRRRGVRLPMRRCALRLRRPGGLASRDGGARAPRRPAARRLSPPRRVASRPPSPEGSGQGRPRRGTVSLRPPSPARPLPGGPRTGESVCTRGSGFGRIGGKGSSGADRALLTFVLHETVFPVRARPQRDPVPAGLADPVAKPGAAPLV